MQSAITLQQLNTLIKSTLDLHLEPSYWVLAEIGEFRDSARGHVYLDMVEKEGAAITAKLRANIWSYTYQGIRRRFEAETGSSLAAGMKILALVSVQFHEVYGLSLIVKDIDPSYTVGERARRRQELINRLHKEGLMEKNKQLSLPPVPQRVAVISSETAAGYGDFVGQLAHNPDRYKVSHTLFQATMQGKDTPQSVVSSLASINSVENRHRFDLIVIIRGGGAQMDMDGFDDYELAKAIAESSLPVVTGIGHERDETVADLVANTKLKTPTAVASFLIGGFKAFEERITTLLVRVERKYQQQLTSEGYKIKELEHHLKNLASKSLRSQQDWLDRKLHNLSLLAKHALHLETMYLQGRMKDLATLSTSCLERASLHIDSLHKQIQHSDPDRLFEKGYTRTERNGKPILGQSLVPGDEITTITHSIRIKSTIKEISDHGKH